MFPPALLAKLYIKGSLRNTSSGFEFKIKNIIETATLIGFQTIVVNEKTYPATVCRVIIEGKEFLGSEISEMNVVLAKAFKDITLQVDADPLLPGNHKIGLQIVTREIGKVQFSFTDSMN